MKEFKNLRTTLSEEVVEENAQRGMPPNILVLRRQSVRQFPDHTMVALYYNDKLDQYFSIPYGGSASTTITPASLKEETSQEAAVKHAEKVSKTWENRRKRWSDWKAKQPKVWDSATKKYVVQKEEVESLTEDAISHLRKVVNFETSSALKHKNGQSTKVDPTTAKALLAVHDALGDENKKKFADHLEHSKEKLHKMVDFAWKQVK